MEADQPLFQVIDDLVPPALHASAWEVCQGKGWYFGHASVPGDGTPFWKLDLDGDPAIDALWAHARPRCEAMVGRPLRVIRQYANGHTYGLGGRPHLDDSQPGTFTLLYYPMPEWREAWEGETVYYDEHREVAAAIRLRPNRAVLFDSRIVHAGRPPSRACPALRVTIAFKLEVVPEPAVSDEPRAEDAASSAGGGAEAEGVRVEVLRATELQRELSIVLPAGAVRAAVERGLVEIGNAVRLPGFRPGKVPLSVLRERYGARARAEAIRRLTAEVAAQALRERGIVPIVPPTITVTAAPEDGDLECTMTVMLRPEVPEVDLSGLQIERLTVDAVEDGPDSPAIELSRTYLRRQVLDHLASVYTFPVPPALVDQEVATISRAFAGRPATELPEPTALRALAERRVRLGLVLATLGPPSGIAVTGEEVERARRAAPDVAAIETPVQTRSRLLEDKVIEHIIASARVTERRAGIDELRRLAGDE